MTTRRRTKPQPAAVAAAEAPAQATTTARAAARARAATPLPAGYRGGEPLSAVLDRGVLLAAACPSREVLRHLTSRWGVLVLMVLERGVHRFSELRRTIGGVSERMLAQTLQWLEEDGLVRREARPTVPPHVDYRLTPLGQEAAERVRGLADWVEVNLPRVLAARADRQQAVARQAAAEPGRLVHRASTGSGRPRGPTATVPRG